jgi:hypothetical protein
LYGSKPTIHNLKVFGCKAFAHIPKENRKKLDAKAIKCIFIGIVLNSKHTNCLILLLTKYLRVEMYFSMRRKQEIMTKTWHRLLDEGIKEEKQQQQQQSSQQQPQLQQQPPQKQQQQQEVLSDMDTSSSHSSPRGKDRSSQSGEEDNRLRRYS